MRRIKTPKSSFIKKLDEKRLKIIGEELNIPTD